MRFFITAIGTDCGKTVISAVFCKSLKADYWKPVQTGSVKDADTIRQYAGGEVNIHKEAFHLMAPVSPHEAARMEGFKINPSGFVFPVTQNHLIIEGAGGVLVPLNDDGDFFIDLIQKEEIKTILVISSYLGCINHALLTCNELCRRNVKIAGLVFNGKDNFGAAEVIKKITGLPVILELSEEKEMNAEIVTKYAEKLKQHESILFS